MLKQLYWVHREWLEGFKETQFCLGLLLTAVRMNVVIQNDF